MMRSNVRFWITLKALPTQKVTLATALLAVAFVLLEGATSLRASPTAACAKPTTSAKYFTTKVTRHASYITCIKVHSIHTATLPY